MLRSFKLPNRFISGLDLNADLSLITDPDIRIIPDPNPPHRGRGENMKGEKYAYRTDIQAPAYVSIYPPQKRKPVCRFNFVPDFRGVGGGGNSFLKLDLRGVGGGSSSFLKLDLAL
jgi:hypothetical protein